jgi:basic amino acid/polyamine antiporter, APA family
VESACGPKEAPAIRPFTVCIGEYNQLKRSSKLISFPIVIDESALKPRLSVFDSVSVVAGSTIGSGIFIVSAGIAREVRSPALLLLVWVAAALMSLTGALTIAELAAMMPVAGGQYVFLRESYGGMCAFLFGWTIVAVVHTGSIAAVAIAFAKYFAILVPAIHSQWRVGFVTFAGERLVAIGLIAVLTLANIQGLQAGRAVQNLFTVAKISALLLIIVVALAILPNHAAVSVNFGNRAAFLGHGGLSLAILPAFGVAMIGAMFSLGGAENLIALGAEVRNPGHSLPFALITGAGLVIVLYLLINLAFMAQLPLVGNPAAADAFGRGISSAQSDRVAAATMQVMWGPTGAALTAILVMISTLGCLNGFILGGGRLMFAMAHDRVFFRIASRLNNASVPGYALMIQALWAAVLVLSGDFGDLLNYMAGAGSLFAVLGIAAVFVLRFKRPQALRPYRVWGYPWIPIVHLIGSAAIFVDLLMVKTRYSVLGLLIASGAIPVYLWNKRRKSQAGDLEAAIVLPPVFPNTRKSETI